VSQANQGYTYEEPLKRETAINSLVNDYCCFEELDGPSPKVPLNAVGYLKQGCPLSSFYGNSWERGNPLQDSSCFDRAVDFDAF
jgi:hypothetical protein